MVVACWKGQVSYYNRELFLGLVFQFQLCFECCWWWQSPHRAGSSTLLTLGQDNSSLCVKCPVPCRMFSGILGLCISSSLCPSCDIQSVIAKCLLGAGPPWLWVCPLEERESLKAEGHHEPLRGGAFILRLRYIKSTSQISAVRTYLDSCDSCVIPKYHFSSCLRHPSTRFVNISFFLIFKMRRFVVKCSNPWGLSPAFTFYDISSTTEILCSYKNFRAENLFVIIDSIPLVLFHK